MNARHHFPSAILDDLYVVDITKSSCCWRWINLDSMGWHPIDTDFLHYKIGKNKNCMCIQRLYIWISLSLKIKQIKIVNTFYGLYCTIHYMNQLESDDQAPLTSICFSFPHVALPLFPYRSLNQAMVVKWYLQVTPWKPFIDLLSNRPVGMRSTRGESDGIKYLQFKFNASFHADEITSTVK